MPCGSPAIKRAAIKPSYFYMMSSLSSRWHVRPTADQIQQMLNEGKHAASLESWLSKYSDVWDWWLIHLIRVDWAVMGTLTWRDDALRQDSDWAQQQRERDFERLLYLTEVDLRLRPKWVRWYRATERFGGGGCHLHFAIARRGLDFVEPQRLAEHLQYVWTKAFANNRTWGRGTADVKVFERAKQLEGVAYLTKIEYSSDGKPYDSHRRPSQNLNNELVRLAQPVKPNEPICYDSNTLISIMGNDRSPRLENSPAKERSSLALTSHQRSDTL